MGYAKSQLQLKAYPQCRAAASNKAPTRDNIGCSMRMYMQYSLKPYCYPIGWWWGLEPMISCTTHIGSGCSCCTWKAIRSMTHARSQHVTASRNGRSRRTRTLLFQGFKYIDCSGPTSRLLQEPIKRAIFGRACSLLLYSVHTYTIYP